MARGGVVKFDKEIYVPIDKDCKVAKSRKDAVLDRVFKVDVEVKWSRSMEGQDADGNRGMMMTSIDDIHYNHIIEVNEEGDDVEVEVDALPNDVFQYIDEAVAEHEVENE